jgi:hypothetical protein
MPQLIYSPWAKFCGKGDEPGANEVCFTGKDARTEAGQPVVAATLIEPEGKQQSCSASPCRGRFRSNTAPV